jgi:flagellar hook-associated protein 3 FlgL
MRVTDFILQNTYLMNLNANKNEVNRIQQQIVTQKKINKPSDSPLGSARLLRYNNQLNDIATFLKNSDYASSFMDRTTTALQSIQDIVVNAQTEFVKMGDPLVKDSLPVYADKVDFYLKNIIDLANSEYDGNSLFGGTEITSKPFSIDSSTSQVSVNNWNISGEQKIKISKSVEQQINIPGDELFLSVMKNAGNFDVNAAAGTNTTLSNTIYDSAGNVYDVSVTYTKTSANNYTMDYSITDSGSSVIASGSHTLAFDAVTGNLSSFDGSTPSKMHIEINSPQIRMLIDPTELTEANKSASISQSQNLKGDVFNTLTAIKDGLKIGQVPNENQIEIINNFGTQILNKSSEAGNYYNRVSNNAEQLQNEETELNRLISGERDTDVAQSIMDLQNRQYALELSYKVSAMILPHSLLDYL